MRNSSATTPYVLPTTWRAVGRFRKYVPATDPPSQAFDLSTEDQRVATWRFDQFRLLGFGEEDAWLLVDSGADLQLTRSLVGSGCPLHLALRIAL
jgi:hypothetical protein